MSIEENLSSQSEINEVLRKSVERRSKLEWAGLARWVMELPLRKDQNESFLRVSAPEGGVGGEKWVDFLDFVDKMEDREAVIVLEVMRGVTRRELIAGGMKDWDIRKAIWKARKFFE